MATVGMAPALANMGDAGFFEWVKGGATPDQVKQYADNYGYTGTQLMNKYNAFAPEKVDASQAATNLGMDLNQFQNWNTNWSGGQYRAPGNLPATWTPSTTGPSNPTYPTTPAPNTPAPTVTPYGPGALGFNTMNFQGATPPGYSGWDEFKTAWQNYTQPAAQNMLYNPDTSQGYNWKAGTDGVWNEGSRQVQQELVNLVKGGYNLNDVSKLIETNLRWRDPGSQLELINRFKTQNPLNMSSPGPTGYNGWTDFYDQIYSSTRPEAGQALEQLRTANPAEYNKLIDDLNAGRITPFQASTRLQGILGGTNPSTPPPGGTPPGFNGLDFSNAQNPYSMSGILDPNIKNSLVQLIQRMTGSVDPYNQSVQSLLGLPGQIDKWTEDRVGSFRIGADDTAKAMNMAANARAAQGGAGGTVARNRTDNILAALVDRVNSQKDEARATGIQQKIAAMMATPSAAFQGVSLLPALFGQAQESKQEDTAAWGNIIANMIRAGFTG